MDNIITKYEKTAQHKSSIYQVLLSNQKLHLSQIPWKIRSSCMQANQKLYLYQCQNAIKLNYDQTEIQLSYKAAITISRFSMLYMSNRQEAL